MPRGAKKSATASQLAIDTPAESTEATEVTSVVTNDEETLTEQPTLVIAAAPPSAPVPSVQAEAPAAVIREPREAETHGIDDYTLPKATVARLAKSVAPNSQIQKDAMTAISRSATVFINYLTATANELTLQAGRKTVTHTDIFKAIEVLELDFFLPRLTAEVDKFLEITANKRAGAGGGAAAATTTPTMVAGNGVAGLSSSSPVTSSSAKVAKMKEELMTTGPESVAAVAINGGCDTPTPAPTLKSAKGRKKARISRDGIAATSGKMMDDDETEELDEETEDEVEDDDITDEEAEEEEAEDGGEDEEGQSQDAAGGTGVDVKMDVPDFVKMEMPDEEEDGVEAEDDEADISNGKAAGLRRSNRRRQQTSKVLTKDVNVMSGSEGDDSD
ncbi:uncharacterized protein V1518DRAFT_184751 [Limtongia smithiae]|uniref:uncharacterized protein n=1 Tax=Limtongia smithiae TaxID=1125753 RepID=UPI0034CDDD1C